MPLGATGRPYHYATEWDYNNRPKVAEKNTRPISPTAYVLYYEQRLEIGRNYLYFPKFSGLHCRNAGISGLQNCPRSRDSGSQDWQPYSGQH